MDELSAISLFDAIKNNDDQGVDAILSRKRSLINIQNNSDESPLLYSVKRGNYSISKLLLANGADVSDHDSPDLQTALHIAAANGDEDLTTLLVKHGAHINITDAYDETPLYAAVRGGHYEVAGILLNHGAQANCHSRPFITPLHWAIFKNDLRMVELLLNYKANVNAVDQSGMSPLHYTVKQNNPQIAQLLAKKNPDPNILDNYLYTPLTLAISKTGDHLQIVSILCRLDAEIDLTRNKVRDYFLNNFEELLLCITDTNCRISIGLKIFLMFYMIEQDSLDCSNLASIIINQIEGYKNFLDLKLHDMQSSETNESNSTELINQLTHHASEWNQLKKIFIEKEPIIHKSLEKLVGVSNNLLNTYSMKRLLKIDQIEHSTTSLSKADEQVSLTGNSSPKKSLSELPPSPEISLSILPITKQISISPKSSPKSSGKKTLGKIKPHLSPIDKTPALSVTIPGNLYIPTKASSPSLNESLTLLEHRPKSAGSPSGIKLKITDSSQNEYLLDLPSNKLSPLSSSSPTRRKTSPIQSKAKPVLEFKLPELETKLNSLSLDSEREVQEDLSKYHVDILGDDI